MQSPLDFLVDRIAKRTEAALAQRGLAWERATIAERKDILSAAFKAAGVDDARCFL